MNQINEQDNTGQSLPKCVKHPTQPGTNECGDCRRYFCDTCIFTTKDNQKICIDCMLLRKKSMPASEAALPPENLEGIQCSIHPSNPATHRCRSCGIPTCDICTFSFPGNLHLCPNCLNKPQEISPRRKKNIIWSYAMAIVCTIGLGLIFLVARGMNSNSNEEAMAFGTLFIFLCLIPSIIGIATGSGARLRGQKTPLSILIPIVWNGLVLGLFILLTIIGNFMK